MIVLLKPRIFLVVGALASPVQAAAEPTPGSVLQSLPAEQPTRLVPGAQIVFPELSLPTRHDPDERRFPVYAFEFHGATLISSQRLKRATERFLDLELNLYDLNQVAADITGYYRRHGYTLARAYVPAQIVTNGVVRIEIVEGRIGNVALSGNKRYDKAFLVERLPNIVTGQVVTTALLESDLLHINQLPGIDARVVLSPGDEPGLTNAEVQVTESLVEGNFDYSNSGSESTGEVRLQANLGLNSPFGWGDRLALNGITTKDNLLKYWRVAYSLPVGRGGARLKLHSSKLAYEVGGVFAALHLAGEFETRGAEITHPLTRTRVDSSEITAGYRVSTSRSMELNHTAVENKIKLYSIAYGGMRVHRDTSISNYLLRLDTNFKRNATGISQDRVLYRIDADINHVLPLSDRWDFYLRSNVVLGKGTLPDTEKFSLGGASSIRGFKPSELRGDSGALLTAELRHPYSFFGRMGQIRAGFDMGWMVYKLPGHTDSSDRLCSAGVGATVFPGKNTFVSIDIAKPLDSTSGASADKQARFWMNLGASF